jgi:hypothetical protein
MPRKLHGEHKLPYPSFRVWTLCRRFFANRDHIADSEVDVTCGICRKAIELARNGGRYAS